MSKPEANGNNQGNTTMAYASTKDYDKGIVIGSFVEKDFGKTFEYCTKDEWEHINPDFPHLLCVNDVIGWCYRFAKIMGTVAYVVTDEADDGSLIVEKWHIKQHRVYNS